jgi:hypothetical protein
MAGNKIRVLARDGETIYRFAIVDQIDDGSGLLLWFHHSQEKVSRHSDGRTWARTAGAGEQVEPAIRVRYSDITQEEIHAVAIPSDLTFRTKPYHGNANEAFVFSTTTLAHNASFAVQLVDPVYLSPALEAWKRHPQYVSAQTCSTNWGGKALIMTVLHDPVSTSSVSSGPQRSC